MQATQLKKMIVQPKSMIVNPSAETLKELVGQMPNAVKSEFGNYNVTTRVLARSKASTYVISDNPSAHSDQTISHSKAAEIATMQDAYIRTCDMVVIEGYIGPDPKTRTAVRLIIEQRNVNIAAMQQQLYFPATAAEHAQFEPELQVIYTPNLEAPEAYPNKRIITVDLENNITRVLNSDYFGESKKGGLRMWNKLVYDRGGLPMHAGCKVIPVGDQHKVGLIIGLSGTGKTTTTFTRQNGSSPIQDDFVGLLPDGSVLATENGCFAKTFGLDPESEPTIFHAVTRPQAYLENVSMQPTGKVDFYDESYTQNGRATFPFSLLPEPPDLSRPYKVDFVLILNRNENIIPAVARLNHVQAAAYFMLGETKGTAAGGKEEAGKALRVPGTNPFFPLLHSQQGTRFLELLKQLPLDVYLMNTGWVGGANGTPHSRKVKIRHSSAVVKAVAEGTIKWVTDPDFGYEVAAEVPGLSGDDQDLLQPRNYYAATGRTDEYRQIVQKLKVDRAEHLRRFPGLPEPIIEAVSV